jgi:hypothetical protein
MFPNPDDHGRIYCMINSGGKPLNSTICDVLMFNAVDMFECGRRTQRIKGRNYDGVIESNLEVIETFAPIVKFEALLATDKWDASPITFGVRVDDLDGIHLQKGKWESIMASVLGLPPLHMLPPEIQRAIREGKGIPINPENIPPELRELIEKKIRQMLEDNDGPEFDVGDPIY